MVPIGKENITQINIFDGANWQREYNPNKYI
jgi:hypothetical protein